MDDLISRQAALDAIRPLQTYKLFEGDDMILVDKAEVQTELMMLPPAELSTNLAEVGTDTISRQAAINKILGQPPEPHYPSWYAEQIKELPSAQPEPLKIDLSGYSEEDWERLKKEWENTPITVLSAQPKKGRWISADAMFHGVPFYCSECGENTMDTVMGKPRWKFCPMCGAKMEGADDE